MTDEELFKRWDKFADKVNGSLYPYRWYLFATALFLGWLAGFYL